MADTTSTLKKDGTPKAKRGEGAASKPRPAYLVYTVLDSSGQPVTGLTLQIDKATRKADDVLAETAGQSVKQYARFEI